MEHCPDAYDQWVKLDREQAERERNAPRCAECGRVVSEVAVRIGEDVYCAECMDEA